MTTTTKIHGFHVMDPPVQDGKTSWARIHTHYPGACMIYHLVERAARSARAGSSLLYRCLLSTPYAYKLTYYA
jgi:hypothetical protein